MRAKGNYGDGKQTQLHQLTAGFWSHGKRLFDGAELGAEGLRGCARRPR
jgi:hypothetical protein